MTTWQAVLLLFVGLVPLLLGGWLALRMMMRNAFLGTKAAGAETPADHDLAYEEHWIELDDRRLQAWYVPGPQADAPALLLFQGGHDTISELGHLQKYLYDHGFATLAFDFTGNGNSSGEPTMDRINADGVATYHLLRELVGADRPIYLWGFSLGAARTLAAAAHGQLDVAGIFLVGPFLSTRAAVHDRLPLPRFAVDTLPQFQSA